MHAHPTLALATLGCRTNQAEAATLLAGLDAICAVVRWPAPADIYLINTCTVTHAAARESRALVRRAHRANPQARIVVTGCAAELEPAPFQALPGVVLVARNQEKAQLAGLIAAWYEEREAPEHALPPGTGDHTRAWLKISEGCNNRCSYCIVPAVRGAETSVAPALLFERAARLADLGYQELVLTGTHVGGYGKELGLGLAELLLQLMDRVPAMPRWRLASIEPLDFPAALVERCADPRLCPQLHLCLQSGSTRILNAMRRRYTAAGYLDLVARLRAARPDLALTTDVIVGFPGETEADFQATLDLIAQVGFAGVHLFPFSRREGTHAASLDGHLPPALVGERMDRARAVAAAAQEAWLQGLVGREVEVLTEQGTGPYLTGGTREGARARLPALGRAFNQRVRAVVEGVADGHLLLLGAGPRKSPQL